MGCVLVTNSQSYHKTMDNDNSSIMDVILRNTKEALDIVQCPMDNGHRGGKANVQNYEVKGLLRMISL